MRDRKNPPNMGNSPLSQMLRDVPTLEPFIKKMMAAGTPAVVQENFAYYYQQLYDNQSGVIREDHIEPVGTLPDAESFSSTLIEAGRREYSKVLQIKLNGGLGTSMGLEKAKSLLPVKDGLSFLDILARQAIHFKVPLVLMNSHRTRADSLATLKRYALPQDTLPRDFVQNLVPKVLKEDLSPASWPENPALEWNPPGHGDFYNAVVTSGILNTFLEHGYEYAFLSNADNLGAVLDPGILGYLSENQYSFLMEVTERTPADRKGGHLARRRDGGLVLRESAQTSPEDMDSFQDILRHRYFNTNNLWIHLPSLEGLLEEKRGLLGLSMIRNQKFLDPRNPQSPEVYQLETAIGAAIEKFKDAAAVRVSRKRFAPVKTTNDLLAVRSNTFLLTSEGRVVPNPDRLLPPLVVNLDPDIFAMIDDFERRFPEGPPDLLSCETLEVQGEFEFPPGVILEGQVKLVNQTDSPIQLAPGSVLSGTITYR